MKYHGLDQGVFDKIEEALKLDVVALQQKNPNVTFMKNEDEDSPMMEQYMPSAIKKEFVDESVDELRHDIRNIADHSGNFLKNISHFASPPAAQASELKAAPFNNYQNNLNLSLELQKLMNEHIMME